jgi:hypothetical protein
MANEKRYVFAVKRSSNLIELSRELISIPTVNSYAEIYMNQDLKLMAVFNDGTEKELIQGVLESEQINI